MPPQLPSTDWEGTPSIRNLTSSDRFDAIPDGFLQGHHTLKGHSGQCLGRERELKNIGQYFGRQWLAEAEGDSDDDVTEDKGFAHIVTNAPGAGKSTVIIEFAMRCAHVGIACPLLKPETFTNEDKFIKALRTYAAKTTSTTTSRVTRTAIRLASNPNWSTAAAGMMFVAGYPIEALQVKAGATALQPMAESILKLWDRSPPTSAEEALALVSRATNGHFILMVDECHKWLNPKTDRDALSGTIAAIVDPDIRQEVGIRGGGLLMAGLGSITRELDGLGLTRAKTTWLPALPIDVAHETIRRKIIAATKKHLDRRNRIAIPWSDQLTADFGSWPQHTAAAAVTARELIRATNRDEEHRGPDLGRDNAQLEWVRTMTADQVIDLYQQRYDAAEKAAGPLAPATMAAIANRTGNRIPKRALHASVRHMLNNDPAQSPRSREDVYGAVSRLIGAGLIRYDDSKDRRRSDLTKAEIPMPCLRRYITEMVSESDPTLMHQAYQLADAALKEGETIRIESDSESE